MRELLWVQLCFDLAMLFALLALERSTGRRSAVRAAHGAREAVPAPHAAAPRRARFALLRRGPREAVPEQPAAAAASGASASPPAGLAELIERAESQELVAEAALRQRLTRFRESAG